MRVCFLCDDLTWNTGTGTYAVELIVRLRRLGITSTVLCTAGRPAEAPEGLDPKPVLTSWSNGYRKPLRTWRDTRCVRRLAGGADHSDPVDVIHAVVEPYAPLAEQLRARGRPTVITAHGTYGVAPFHHWYQRRFYSRAFRRAAAVVCVSDYTARAVREQVRAATRVIYSGVSIERFDGAPGPRENDPLVVCVGAIKPRKGQDVLVRAFAQVRQAVPRARLVLIGSVHSGAYAQRLRELVSQLGLGEAVSFEEQVSAADLLHWYRRAWVFALTPVNVGAHFEGFGLVYIEAGACGVPSVATRGNGAEEAVLDGETGLVVAQHDVATTARAIARLLTDDALRDRMGRAARRRAEMLTWERTAERYAALYEEALRR
ncbi:MAG: glycosyltransferase family 4 protein [Verrucomicrobia bacterium]|nr:glycosyltransferase family 4 protein [Verrucomicrobiota bacterium]